jgi:hypothetical protein
MLHEGKMTQKELAEFFGGISRQAFCKNKEKYLEKLKKYADYHIYKGSVYIDKVKKEYYQEDEFDLRPYITSAIHQLNQSSWGENTYVGSCTLIADIIYEDVTEARAKAGLRSWCYNTLISRIRECNSDYLYGKIIPRRVHRQTLQKRGEAGTACSTVLIDDKTGKYRELNHEDWEIFRRHLSDYCKDLTDDELQDFLEWACVETRLDEYGDMTVRDFVKQYKKSIRNFYSEVIKPFLDETGYILVNRGTLWDEREILVQ